MVPRNAIITADLLDEIRQSVRDTWDNAVEQPKVYRLGRKLSDTQYEIKGGRPGEVWVRPVTGPDEVGQAVIAVNTVLSEDQLIYGTFVDVLPWRGGLRIIGRAPEDAEYNGDIVVQQQAYTDASHFLPGLITPSRPASNYVIINETFRVFDSTAYYQPSLLSKDFASDRPAAGNAIGVKLEVDPTTNVITYTNSSSFAETISPLAAFNAGTLSNTVSSGQFLLGYVVLRGSADVIQREDVLTAHEIITKGASGGEIVYNGFGQQFHTSAGNLITL